MQMRDRISRFLEEKQGLSANSKQSYKYDLEQFLDIVGERFLIPVSRFTKPN